MKRHRKLKGDYGFVKESKGGLVANTMKVGKNLRIPKFNYLKKR